jgi:hypothetical protein
MRICHVFDGTYSDLELMFSSSIGYYFPIVDTLVKLNITEKVAEYV